MKQEIILYHAHWSICSQMVRVALYEKGLSFKSERIELCDQSDKAGNLTDDFLKNINPTAVVPVLKLNDEIIRDSANIIERIDDLKGDNEINLWPQDPVKRSELKKWVEDTTLTEGVGLGRSLGTMVPLFSTGLIEDLIKNLKFKSILRIIFKHPRRERKIAFLTMYFSSLKNRIGPIVYNRFTRELIALENNLDDKSFLLGAFSHADINLMCCFNRLVEMKMESLLEMPELPNITKYWQNLKSRKSYQQGVLDYPDHEEMLKKIFNSGPNPHLEIIQNKIIEQLNS